MCASSFASFLLALAGVGALAGAQGRVYVVDATSGPGSDFTSIHQAMGSTVEGDVVLVRTGTYGWLYTLSAHLVAEAGADVHLYTLTPFEGLEAGSARLVQGVRFYGATLAHSPGPLWFERSGFAEGGIRASNCDDLVFSRCRARSPRSPRMLAAELDGSRVHAHESAFITSDGLDGVGPALRVLGGSFVELFGTRVLGDDGEDGGSISCNGGDGSDALHLLGVSELVTLGASLVGGRGGQPTGTCEPGVDGSPLVVEAGSSVTARAGSARSLAIESPVREGRSFTATFRGEPGDLVWLRYASAPGPGIARTGLDGEFLLSSSSFGFFVGTIPASGEIVQTIGGLSLPSDWESTIFWCQAVMRDAETQRFVVSSPSALVLLDESI